LSTTGSDEKSNAVALSVTSHRPPRRPPGHDGTAKS
jgi:hypothetical protein